MNQLNQKKNYSEITPEISRLSEICVKNNTIDQEHYNRYHVFRGLRDLDGNGVLTGLTEISEIKSKEIRDGKAYPCEGELYYRGYNVRDIVSAASAEDRFAFEEVVYLLLMGRLPTAAELASFSKLLGEYRSLPNSFTRDVIMKAPSADIMNSLARSVLTLYSYDRNAEDISLENVLRQSLQLVSMMPMLSIYAYQAQNYYLNKQGSLYIYDPDPDLSTAENILDAPPRQEIHPNRRVLDIALAPRRARRRQQFHLYDPCGLILRNGHLFRDCRGSLLAKRT